MPAQLTIRADPALIERVRAVARRRGRSMNEHVVRILEAATDPDLAGDEATRLRERLAAAGLLADPPEAVAAVAAAEAPSAGRLAAARSRAGSGTALADLVHGGR